ncbi:MAG: MerR family transcriptional regulator [Pseudomonadales bacterium]
MKIGQISAQTGLSAHTIRYYEKRGLIAVASKDSSGHRAYSTDDLELLNWIGCMKKSGMSLARIQQYVEASASGDRSTACAMLEEHLVRLEQQRKDIEHYIEVTAHKITSLSATNATAKKTQKAS